MSSKDESDLSKQVKFLQDVLQSASVNDETAADNLAVLLRQLDEAGDVAQGVEGKLDKLLENLEGMIEELEGNNKHSGNPTTTSNDTNGHLNEQRDKNKADS